MEKINIAVIGTGTMGKNHARIYSELDNVNLVAVCDSNEEIAKEIARSYKTKYYTNYKEMLEKEKINAVSVCVPTKFHKQVALDVINKGINGLFNKHIFSSIKCSFTNLKVSFIASTHTYCFNI